jgi:nucleoside-diphosphate-sugar epimerase
MQNHKTALVLGATGGVGGAIARELVKAGWAVKALARTPPETGFAAEEFQWFKGDALNPEDVDRAAEGASLIVHAVNPPAYHAWDKLVLPMLQATIGAAVRRGAMIFLPGTVYNFGPETFPLVGEDAPQRPLTRKGKIRVEMEARLRAASDAGARVLILRTGDFFGPGATRNSWFASGMVVPGRPLSFVLNPGRRGVGHAFAYLPDVARTAVRLIERDESLPAFSVFHFGGHWFEDVGELARTIRTVAQKPRIPILPFPWPLIYLLAPFIEACREMLEMTYLWRRPLRLDNRALVRFLGEEPHTPTPEAVRASLEVLGCIA